MINLKAHGQNPINNYSVSSEYYVSDDHFIVNFDVHGHKVSTDNKFKQFSFDNWGLWNFDVVEIFLKKEEGTSSYLELQASPINQFFSLLVIEPRIKTESIDCQGVEINSELMEEGFKTQFRIPLNLIPGESGKIIGNVFACLGKKDKRCYFSSNPNKESTPDFHRPDLFMELS